MALVCQMTVVAQNYKFGKVSKEEVEEKEKNKPKKNNKIKLNNIFLSIFLQ